MFDLNGDGKLGLSEMARWASLLGFICSSFWKLLFRSPLAGLCFSPQASAGPGELPAQISGEITPSKNKKHQLSSAFSLKYSPSQECLFKTFELFHV